MQIKTIALYGKNGERRDVDFTLSQVNIITGASKKGKSSLLDIVEYCLGSSECSVAEGHIIDTVDWYSILLQFKDTQVFVARAAPLKGRKSNTKAFMSIQKDIELPDYSELDGTTNIASVVDYLTSKLGIPEQETEVPADQTRSSINIGFKHSRYYLFQGQDEVAAKRILFHRQSEPHIPQAITDTFPYFMGAAEDDRLAQTEKLRALKREKIRILKRIREVESLKGEGLKKGYDLLAEAANVGLHATGFTLTDEELIEALKKVTQWSRTKQDNSDIEKDPLIHLESQNRVLSDQKKAVRSRIRAANEYAISIGGYENEVSEQALRLKSIGLYKKLSDSRKYDVSTSNIGEQNSLEKIMANSVSTLNDRLEGVARSRPRVTGYIEKLRAEDRILAENIKKIRNSIEIIRKKDIEAAEREKLDEERFKVVGRVSLYLDSVNFGEDLNPLNKRVSELTPQIESLEQELDPTSLREKLESQLSLVSEDMTKWARELDLEHSEHPIRLDPIKLTVVAETPHGRTPLYRMGSGENWVGYHLVTYLALAKWFIKQGRPVGNFIFFDQPTQVYFPAEKSVTGNLAEIKDDEDRQAVHRMFKWIDKIVKELSPNLQVIITDHADIDEEWFQSLVADSKWRGDIALIPKSWYE